MFLSASETHNFKNINRPVADSIKTLESLAPQVLGTPWGGTPLRVDLAAACERFGARFTLATTTGVDAATRHVLLSGGGRIAYDELLLAPGARRELAHAGTRTVGFGMLPSALATDVTGSVAIVVPAGASWTLPAYELALLCAREGRDVRVLTPEHRPLEAFGPGTYEATAALLARERVGVALRSAPTPGSAVSELADTVVSLPLQHGPDLTGLPLAARGFVRVDERMGVAGLEHVHAAGDVTDGPVKQGGLAAQQADTAAAEIVRALADDPEAVHPVAYEPVLRGVLVAGDGEELFLRRALNGRDGGCSSAHALWQPPSVVCAWRLARWLVHHDGELPHPTLGHIGALA